MNNMAGHQHAIRKWLNVSYYLNEKRKWVYGTLVITEKFVTFTSIDDFKLILPFDKISQIKKKTSMILYSAIVLVEDNYTCHWLSSFRNRDAAYNVIYNFRREILVDNVTVKHGAHSPGQTEVGRQLLKSAVDSENKLTGAAKQLHYQGLQLNNASGVMVDIENDVKIGEHLLEGLESWLGRWNAVSSRTSSERPINIDMSTIPDIASIDCLYQWKELNHLHSEKCGCLQITPDGITLSDNKQNTVHLFKAQDVSEVLIMSPWELIVTKYVIGEPDLRYVILSQTLSDCYRVLQKLYQRKLVFDDPQKIETILVSPISPPPLQNTDHTLSQTKQKELQTMPDSDVDELQRIVGRMKVMAHDVGQEVSQQNETIDQLNVSVDRANISVSSVTKRTNELLK